MTKQEAAKIADDLETIAIPLEGEAAHGLELGLSPEHVKGLLKELEKAESEVTYDGSFVGRHETVKGAPDKALAAARALDGAAIGSLQKIVAGHGNPGRLGRMADAALHKATADKKKAVADLRAYAAVSATGPYVYDVTDTGTASGSNLHDFYNSPGRQFSGSVNTSWTIHFTVDVTCISTTKCTEFVLSPPSQCTWSFCYGNQLATSESGSISEEVTSIVNGTTYYCSYTEVPITEDTFHFEWSSQQISNGIVAVYPGSAHINQQDIPGHTVPNPGTCTANTGEPTYYPSGADLLGMQGPGCDAWTFTVRGDQMGKLSFVAADGAFPALSPNCETTLGAVAAAATDRTVTWTLVKG